MRFTVRRVIVVPRNGYINRMQAMASASVLAGELKAEFSVSWLPQVAAPAPPATLFNLEAVSDFVTEAELNEILGNDLNSFPRYVNSHFVPGVGRVVTFAGHDRGEQPLMSELLHELKSLDWGVLVIVAGGRFSSTAGSQPVAWDSDSFRAARKSWYQNLELSPEIDRLRPVTEWEPFVGLHLRYSDRSHQTPSRTEIRRAVVDLCKKFGVSRVFLASDSSEQLDYWRELLPKLGLSPWILETNVPGEFTGAQLALADWKALTHAKAIVYFAESSFGYEAAVASGGFAESTSLAPNKLVSAGVQAKSLIANVLSAPKRRGWY